MKKLSKKMKLLLKKQTKLQRTLKLATHFQWRLTKLIQ